MGKKVRLGFFRRNPFRDWKAIRRRSFRVLLMILALIILTPPTLVLVYRDFFVPVTPLMVVRLLEGEGIRKDWVPLNRISRHVPAAVIALEDTKFCEHAGFDWAALSDAAADYFRGEKLRGGSTITMQTAKNVFLWPSRTMTRKAFEVPFTTMIEWTWGKRRIMEVYLNVIEFGPGIYGVEAAARAYFGKSARSLTRREAALLAAILPNPRHWSPRRPSRFVERRANLAMFRARRLGPAGSCVR